MYKEYDNELSYPYNTALEGTYYSMSRNYGAVAPALSNTLLSSVMMIICTSQLYLHILLWCLQAI